MTAAEVKVATLRCHYCSHALVQADAVMELVGMFHPRRVDREVEIFAGERRHRCGSCGWMNIFRPRAGSRAEVVVK